MEEIHPDRPVAAPFKKKRLAESRSGVEGFGSHGSGPTADVSPAPSRWRARVWFKVSWPHGGVSAHCGFDLLRLGRGNAATRDIQRCDMEHVSEATLQGVGTGGEADFDGSSPVADFQAATAACHHW